MDPVQNIRLVSRRTRAPRPPLSDWAWKLIQSCWVRETSRRPAMKDVVERMMVAQNVTPNLIPNSGGHPIPSLLSILRDKKVRQS
jgi:hypothetical protein